MRKRIDRTLEKALVILMAVLVIKVLWQVATRYVFNDPSGFTDELAGFLLIWVGLLGAAYVTGKRLHLAIDLMLRRMEAERAVRLDKFIHVLIFLFSLAVFVAGGGRLVYLMLLYGQTSADIQIPLGYVYTVLPLSGVLTCYYCLSNMFAKRLG